MYKCTECGHLFEEGEQKKWTESHGERLEGCPLCYGNYEEAYPCEICGTYDDVDGDFCMECEKSVKNKMKLFLETLTKEEIKLLNKLYEGEEICIEQLNSD